MKKQLRSVVIAALIAAVYTVLSLILAPLTFGALQCRVSEILTILPAFCPAAIWGLTVGCLLTNLASFLPLDLIFGTLATLFSALLSFWFRRIRFKGYPVLSALCPVLINAGIIGMELTLYSGAFSFRVFFLSALSVGAGEAAACTVGLLLTPLWRRIFPEH